MPSDRDMSSGRTSEARSPRAPLARWNPSRDCWETDRVDLLSGLSDVWSETWPTAGTWADPTEPGPSGKPRLSARFVEWMMCLPDGWVTDVPGLSRSEQLALLGNGVVPPQGAAALRHLIDAA